MARRQATGFSFSVSRARERALFPSFLVPVRSFVRSFVRSLARSLARAPPLRRSLSLTFGLPPSQTPVPMPLLALTPRVPEDTARSSANLASRMQRAILALARCSRSFQGSRFDLRSRVRPSEPLARPVATRINTRDGHMIAARCLPACLPAPLPSPPPSPSPSPP